MNKVYSEQNVNRVAGPSDNTKSQRPRHNRILRDSHQLRQLVHSVRLSRFLHFHHLSVIHWLDVAFSDSDLQRYQKYKLEGSYLHTCVVCTPYLLVSSNALRLTLSAPSTSRAFSYFLITHLLIKRWRLPWQCLDCLESSAWFEWKLLRQFNCSPNQHPIMLQTPLSRFRNKPIRRPSRSLQR